jgi:hypothetical protein
MHSRIAAVARVWRPSIREVCTANATGVSDAIVSFAHSVVGLIIFSPPFVYQL